MSKVEQVYKENGQGQVFSYWNDLNDSEKQQFEKQLETVDPKHANAIFETAVNAPEIDKSAPKPPPSSSTGSRIDASDAQVNSWTNTGLQAIKDGKVAVVLMAGGQGTRLGSSLPKGCYDIGLPSHKSLFQIQAERLAKVAENAGSSAGIPWYIMTSGPTRQPTEEFFEKNKYFGLNKDNVIFFEQGVLPCYSNDGKFLLESKGSLATAPGGNGGIYDAMRSKQLYNGTSSVLEDLKKRGVEYIHTYGVDNCLVRIADPSFMGYCIEQNAEIGAKVVRKRSPDEAVGVIGLPDGKHFGVIEYSEIPKDLSEAKDESGQLLFRAANIVNHFFTLSFLNRVEEFEHKMYYHVAKKKIPSIDYNTGEFVKPTTPNGIKLELFVFDVFPFSDRVNLFEVDRKQEFSPLKNAPGTGEDDPETSRRDLLNEHKQWLEAVGCNVEGDVEISPLVSYAGEGLEKYKGQTVSGILNP